MERKIKSNHVLSEMTLSPVMKHYGPRYRIIFRHDYLDRAGGYRWVLPRVPYIFYKILLISNDRFLACYFKVPYTRACTYHWSPLISLFVWDCSSCVYVGYCERACVHVLFAPERWWYRPLLRPPHQRPAHPPPCVTKTVGAVGPHRTVIESNVESNRELTPPPAAGSTVPRKSSSGQRPSLAFLPPSVVSATRQHVRRRRFQSIN